VTGGSKWFQDGRLHFALGFEDTFVPQSSPGQRPLDEYELTEHYERFAEDFAAVAASGAEFLRWGIPWYRVNPEPQRWDWDWTDRAVDSMLEHGVRPIVDLMHYGTPTWLDREFASPEYADRVAEYSARAAERFGDRITDWTPLNEPMIHALFCGQYGYWPPYGTTPADFARVSVNLARGFAQAQHAIAEVSEEATFVHVDSAMHFVAQEGSSSAAATATHLNQVRFLIEDLVTGALDAQHPLADELLQAGIGEEELTWFHEHPARPDVMGVNYYPRHATELVEDPEVHRGGFDDPRPAVDRGVEGLLEALHAWADRYGAPVMLTETCVTASHQERIDWLNDSLQALVTEKAGGLDLVGYTWWPLFDMYEWTYRPASGPRSDHLLAMGLQDLVETPHGLERRDNPVLPAFRRAAAQYGPPRD
jgi:beta-glucosidase/6-phospho-beta-glucosidase/beta-galactosidase